MFYDRRVRYLDYCKNGERIKSGGFARTEIDGDFFKLELSLKGISVFEGKTAEVILTDLEGETVLGQVRIENGCGSFWYQGNLRRDLPGRELQFGELTGIRIPISEEVQVSCSWPAEKRDNGAEKQREEAGRERKKLRKGEDRDGEGAEKLSAEKSAEIDRTEVKQQEQKANEFVRRLRGHPEQEPERKAVPGGEAGSAGESRRVRTVKLLEDKWRQLWAIYPHIQPFHDERDYLSLGPADFVLFSEESYRAVNNSFLLHGYYNYRHLILTRMEKRGEIIYYLGVPGSYFDREKQVAVMFGFESFECAEEPAQEGDFGYYMMKVTL